MGDARKLLTHFQGILAYRPSSINMLKMTAFALFSTRRQEEITRIKWADLDEAGNRVLVRDMKNPGQKLGNDVWCHLPPEAMAIIQTMPKAVEEIFPYNAESISASWTRACKFLGIEDLHFHDLRHEASADCLKWIGTFLGWPACPGIGTGTPCAVGWVWSGLPV